MARTDLQIAADRRTEAQQRDIAEKLRALVEDAGVSQRQLATIAGLAQGYISDVLAGTEHPSMAAYHRIAAALGADLSLALYPNTGPRLHDRWQAPMQEAVLRARHPRWEPYLEAFVTRPVQGWVDVALHERREEVLVASELQSELRRIEQLVRWHAAKARSLPSWEGFVHLGNAPRISQLLIVRRTRATRSVVAEFERQLRVAYPAHPDDAVGALTGVAPWPGAALAWMVVEGGRARLVPGR
jgi:transcriptional regulator with XRE-family HTH domain